MLFKIFNILLCYGCKNKGNYSKIGKFILFNIDKKDKVVSVFIIVVVVLWISCIKINTR